jgi:hypothetical protein
LCLQDNWDDDDDENKEEAEVKPGKPRCLFSFFFLLFLWLLNNQIIDLLVFCLTAGSHEEKKE